MDTLSWVLLVISLVLFVSLLVIVSRKRTNEPSQNQYIQPLITRLEDLVALKQQIEQVSKEQDNLRTGFTNLQGAIQSVEVKVIQTSGDAKQSLLKDISSTRELITGIKTELDNRKIIDAELKESSRRIEAVITGSSSRGKAGENILSETFKKMPADIIDINFKVKGKPVEYALKLTDGKRIPIDSKWPASNLLEQLDLEQDTAKREAIIKEIQQVLLSKIKEVKKYIDPERTTPWGVAAVPDSVFYACGDIHLNAYQEKVIVMPYSLALVYLLTLYQYHLQYSRTIDIGKLDKYLDSIEEGLKKIDKELDNRIKDGITQIDNAYRTCKEQVAQMTSACTNLKIIPKEEPSIETSSNVVEQNLET